MEEFSLIVELPELYDQKEAKELKSSLDNLLHDSFKLFEQATREIKSKNFKCGIEVAFENGDTFHILMKYVNKITKVFVGFETESGELETKLSYNQAININKYALEMSMALHRQKQLLGHDEFPDNIKIEGMYSKPSSIPIYKSRDSAYNFDSGIGHVKFVKR